MRGHPLRAVAWGDVSSTPTSRSGDQEVGAWLECPLGTLDLILRLGGAWELRLRDGKETLLASGVIPAPDSQ